MYFSSMTEAESWSLLDVVETRSSFDLTPKFRYYTRVLVAQGDRPI